MKWHSDIDLSMLESSIAAELDIIIMMEHLPENLRLAVEEFSEGIASQSKMSRRASLEKFRLTLQELSNDGGASVQLYTAVCTQILRTLGDESEACRVIAVEIMKMFIQQCGMNDYQLTYILPAVVKRIGQPEIVEDSEELRLAFIQLVQSIISHNEASSLEPFMNDFTAILCKTIQDPFPDARVDSAACIELLALKAPRVFYMRSESFVKPVLPSLAHQRYKVRVAAVKCLGIIVMAGTAKCLELSTTPLAEKLFDEVANVRRQVVREVSHWMLQHRDRYSYWHRMLPIVLTGLSDADEPIRTESAQLWNEIGLKFMEENEEDLKKYTDFMSNDIPDGYPNVARPNLGCRTLVCRNIGKILPAIERECSGWQADARVRSVQLLGWLLLCAEDGGTQHALIASNILLAAARDDDPRVVYEMQQAAVYFGIFIAPQTWWRLLRPGLPASATVLVMAYVVAGAGSKLLADEAGVLKEIMMEVSDPDVCETRKEQLQRALLILCDNVMKNVLTEEEAAKVSAELFRVVFTVYAVAEGELKRSARDVLHTLMTTAGHESLGGLYKEYARSTLALITSEAMDWTVFTPHYCILHAMLTEFEGGLSVIPEELGVLLQRVLTESKLLAEVKVKLYSALSLMLLGKTANFRGADKDKLVAFYRSIRQDVIMPALQWQPGLTAESVRAAAATSLCCLLQEEVREDDEILDRSDQADKCSERVEDDIAIFDTDSQVTSLTEELVTLVPSLLDDRSDLTRRRALLVAAAVANIAHGRSLFTEEHLHKMYYPVLKRLDDSSAQVRSLSARVLVSLFRCRPTPYDAAQYAAHIDAVYSAMLVHLDDPDDVFRTHILDCLLNLVDLDPQLLLKKVRANLPLYMNKEAFQALENSISKLSVT